MIEDTMNDQQIREAWQHLQGLRRAGLDAIFTGTHERRQELVVQQKAAVKVLESLGSGVRMSNTDEMNRLAAERLRLRESRKNARAAMHTG